MDLREALVKLWKNNSVFTQIRFSGCSFLRFTDSGFILVDGCGSRVYRWRCTINPRVRISKAFLDNLQRVLEDNEWRFLLVVDKIGDMSKNWNFIVNILTKVRNVSDYPQRYIRCFRRVGGTVCLIEIRVNDICISEDGVFLCGDRRKKFIAGDDYGNYYIRLYTGTDEEFREFVSVISDISIIKNKIAEFLRYYSLFVLFP